MAHPSPAGFETVRFLGSDPIRLSGRLSARFAGNRRYLEAVYEKKKDWMLEPFRHRGREWVLEPLRNQKGELPWAGEYAGKWLDAACLAAAGDPEGKLGEYAGAFARELIATQEPDGYLGIEAPGRRGVGTAWDLWNLKYAITGLLTHYEVFEAHASLQAAARCGEWLVDRCGPISGHEDPYFGGPEEGGVNACILDQIVRLYRCTGEEKFREFASQIVTWFPRFSQMRASHQALPVHAYNLTACLGGVVDWAAAVDDQDELGWVEKVWEDVAARLLYPTGSISYNELLRDAPNDTPVLDGQPGRHHQETCATVEWLMLNARLFEATGKVRYAQAMEQSIYNALLAAQSIDGLSWMYFTPLRYEKRWFSGPTSCCYWSGPRGVARLPGYVYALDGEGIRVNLYEASEASFRLDGCPVAIELSGLYPEQGRVTLQVRPEAPLRFALRLSIPPGCSEAKIALNGAPLPPGPLEDGYFPIRRTWSDGDRVEMEFELAATVRPFPENGYGVLQRGPEILAVDQDANPGLELDRLTLPQSMALQRERGQIRGEALSEGQPVQVNFTPYADCGNGGSLFRTAFPIESPPIIELYHECHEWTNDTNKLDK